MSARIRIMVMAEISVVPIGTGKTGVSFYVARALESVSDMPGLRYQLNPMGTVMEADDIDTILEATKGMVETLHNLGADRVGVTLKIDSRRDKSGTMDGKVEAVRRHMS